MELWRYGYPIKQLGGRYSLIRPLGGGGMADVCVAWDEHDRREVAIKVVKPEMLGPRMLQRFLRESEVVAALNHSHIIRVYGSAVEAFSHPDPTTADVCKVPYIVMEYVKGGDLKKRLVPGQPCPPNEILSIFAQLCAAVQYAHDRGVIHRDIKPANILFREHPQQDEQVVLSDFGLALLADDTHYSLPEAGTPCYMALEQWQGKPEFASDIFSLGIVLYQLCTGYLPSLLQPPKRAILLNPDLPPALDDVILRALSNQPSQRFASASLFWQAVQNAVGQTLPPLRSQANPILSCYSNGSSSALPITQSPDSPLSVVLSPEDITQAAMKWSRSVITDEVTQVVLPSTSSNAITRRKQLIGKLKQYILGVFRKTKQSSTNPSSSPLSDNVAAADFSPASQGPLKDFFISYARADRSWAKWITWQLDKAGYSTELLAWGVQSDFEEEIQVAAACAKRVIVVLSPDYHNMFSSQTNWIETFKQKARENAKMFLPVCVRECQYELRKLLESIISLDLSLEDEVTASEMLLAGVGNRGVKLTVPPVFPGKDETPIFPGGDCVPSSSLNFMNRAGIPLSSSITTVSHAQQSHSAFNKKDWSNMTRRVEALLR